MQKTAAKVSEKGVPAGTVAAARLAPYAPGLDGLRALCALGVLAYHMGVSWCQGGLHGVSVLFVLSGYLVTVSLVRELRTHGTISLPRFWARRLWRLMPTAVAFVVVTLLLCVSFSHPLLTKMRPDIAPALLMYLNWAKIAAKLSYFDAAGQASPLTHFWSLAIEAQFYLVWPILLLVATRLTRSRRSLARMCCAIAVASAVEMWVIYDLTGDITRVYYGSDTRAMSLFAGAALGLVWGLDGRPVPSAAKRQGGSALVRLLAGFDHSLMGCLSVAGIIAVMTCADGTSDFSYHGGVLLVSVLACLAIVSLTARGSLAERVLSLSPLAWLGKRAYAIYVWHYPIVELMNPLNRTTPLAWWEPIAQVAAVLAAAELSYELVEKPLRHGLSTDLAAAPADAGTAAPYQAGSHGRSRGAGKHGAPSSRARRQAPIAARWARRHVPSAVTLVALVVVLVMGVRGSAQVPDTTPQGEVAQDQVVMHATLRHPLKDGVYDVVLIGDSVSLGARDQLNAIFPHGLIDSEGSRQAMPALEVFKGYLDEGVVGDTVIFSVGTNGWLTDDQLDQIVEAVGDRQLWFINIRGPYQQYVENNAVIQRTVDKYDNVNLIDWHAATEGHDEYLSTDGIHLSGAGREAFANLVRDTIGYEVPTEENTTYTVTTIGGADLLSIADQVQQRWPGGIVDAADGRSFDDSLESLRGYVSQGVVGKNVVFSLDGVGELSQDQLASLADAVPDGTRLWIVNERDSSSACEANNRLADQVASSNDDVEVVDWYGASAGHDDYLSADDGVSLTESGRKAFAELVTGIAVTE